MYRLCSLVTLCLNEFYQFYLIEGSWLSSSCTALLTAPTLLLRNIKMFYFYRVPSSEQQESVHPSEHLYTTNNSSRVKQINQELDTNIIEAGIWPVISLIWWSRFNKWFRNSSAANWDQINLHESRNQSELISEVIKSQLIISTRSVLTRSVACKVSLIELIKNNDDREQHVPAHDKISSCHH